MAQFHGNRSGEHVHGDGGVPAGVPTIGTITPTADGCVFTHSGGGTHYRIFVLAGSPGAWVSLPASPVTVIGLTANTEYTLQLSADASTVADAEDWGTLNPGVGGGGVAQEVGRADEADTAFALAGVTIKAHGRADEADTALGLAGRQIKAAGRADESDAAFALASVQVRAVGRADEADTAVALNPAVLNGVGVAVETDTAFALAAAIGPIPVGLAVETDTALALFPYVEPPAPPPAPPPSVVGGGGYGGDLKRLLRREQERDEAEVAEVAELLMALATAGVFD